MKVTCNKTELKCRQLKRLEQKWRNSLLTRETAQFVAKIMIIIAVIISLFRSVKVKVPILVYIERKGPELIPDSRQSACRWKHA